MVLSKHSESQRYYSIDGSIKRGTIVLTVHKIAVNVSQHERNLLKKRKIKNKEPIAELNKLQWKIKAKLWNNAKHWERESKESGSRHHILATSRKGTNEETKEWL